MLRGNTIISVFIILMYLLHLLYYMRYENKNVFYVLIKDRNTILEIIRRKIVSKLLFKKIETITYYCF